MENQSGIDELEAWLSSLAPRAELVARMALRLRSHVLCDDRRYFARIASLIKELGLTPEELSTVRADAQKVAGCVDTGSRAANDPLAPRQAGAKQHHS